MIYKGVFSRLIIVGCFSEISIIGGLKNYIQLKDKLNNFPLDNNWNIYLYIFPNYWTDRQYLAILFPMYVYKTFLWKKENLNLHNKINLYIVFRCFKTTIFICKGVFSRFIIVGCFSGICIIIVWSMICRSRTKMHNFLLNHYWYIYIYIYSPNIGQTANIRLFYNKCMVMKSFSDKKTI